MATKTTKKTYEVPNKSGGYTTVTSTSKAGAVSQVGSNANLKSGGSSSSNTPSISNPNNLNLYNSQTGALLNPGETYTNAQGQKVTQGTPFSLDTTKPVQSDKLGQPQIPVATAPTAPDYTGTVTQALGTVTPIEPTEQSIQQSATDRFDKYLASQKEAPNLMEIQNKLEKQNQIQSKQEKVNTYQTQLNSIVAKAQADVLGTQGLGRGIPEAIIGGQQAQINKEAAIQALPIQALLSSAQGDLQTAQSHVDKLFGIYAQDAENQVKFFNDQSKLVYDFATKQEQQQLDRLNEQKKFEQNILVSKMDAQQSYATEALKNGNITLFNRLTAIQPPTNVNSPTYQQDLATYEQKVNSAVAKYGTVAGAGAPKIQEITKADGTKVSATWNATTGKFEEVKLDGSSMGNDSVQKTSDQLSFLKSTITGAKGLAGAAGPNMITQGLGNFFVGNTKVKQLATKLDTLKVNLLTLNADPAIKKFFGPQMSERDSQLMQSAGSTLDAYTNTETDLTDELVRYESLIDRMQKSVTGGMNDTSTEEAELRAAGYTDAQIQELKKH